MNYMIFGYNLEVYSALIGGGLIGIVWLGVLVTNRVFETRAKSKTPKEIREAIESADRNLRAVHDTLNNFYPFFRDLETKGVRV